MAVYIYIYIYMGDSCIRSTRVEAGYTQIGEKYITNIKNDHNLRHAFPDTSSTGGSVRANIFRYPLQKIGGGLSE